MVYSSTLLYSGAMGYPSTLLYRGAMVYYSTLLHSGMLLISKINPKFGSRFTSVTMFVVKSVFHQLGPSGPNWFSSSDVCVYFRLISLLDVLFSEALIGPQIT